MVVFPPLPYLDLTASYSIFSSHIVFKMVLIKYQVWSGKHGCPLALLWLCESLYSFLLKDRFDEMESEWGRTESGQGAREEKERQGRMLRREGGGWRRIVVCFPTHNSRGSGMEQLNIQTTQWGRECEAAVEQGCHQVQECETQRTACIYTGRDDWEHTLHPRYLPSPPPHPDSQQRFRYKHTPVITCTTTLW